MKTLKCVDMGMSCDFVATGATNDEVKAAFLNHAQEAHKELAEGATEEQKQELSAKIDAAIQDEEADEQQSEPEEETPASEAVTTEQTTGSQ